MAYEKKPGSEPIRGYRLLAPLGRGGYGEVWKCEAPGGIHKAIKFVYGNLGGLDDTTRMAEEELRAVQRIKSIRHPFLLSIDRVENVAGELAIVTELADHNLHQLLESYRRQGAPGVPRQELLGYLKEAAEVLDLLNLKFDLQHLDIKPRNLFLVSGHVKVADFGLVKSLSGAGQLSMEALTPLYAAPELFQGRLSRQADQYSLALTYQELLTGALPFKGKNTRQLLLEHTHGEPDLSALPAEDRPIVARALAKDPERRHASCTELIGALLGRSLEPRLPSAVGSVLSASAERGEAATETSGNQIARTPSPRVRRAPTLPPALAAEYRFVDNIANTPFEEVWRVEGADGVDRQLRFLFVGAADDAETFQARLARLRSIHHPGLAETEVVHAEPGRLLLLAALHHETLRDRFQQCLGQKLPGIGRAELVETMRAAAEVLDYLFQQHGVQHLCLNPRQLVLDHGWLQINDFGLGQLFWQPAGHDLTRLNGRYAAPELFERRTSTACDQYSLALIYAELLSGSYCFGGPGLSHRAEPNLSAMPDLDRAVIRRALALDPAQRWPSCQEMVMALEGSSAGAEPALGQASDHFTALIENARGCLPVAPAAQAVDLRRAVAMLIASVGGEEAAQQLDDVAELSAHGDRLVHTFRAGLPLGAARRKLQGFAETYQGEIKRCEEQDLVFDVRVPASLWDQLLGRQARIEVALHLERVHPLSPTPIEASLTIAATGKSRRQSIRLLEEVGPCIVDGLRQTLLVDANKRAQERFLWPGSVTLIPLDPDGRRQPAVVCRGKDLSADGLGVYMPHDLNTTDVLIELPNLETGGVVEVPGTLVRAKCCADGWYDVGVLFRLPSVRRSAIETPAVAAR